MVEFDSTGFHLPRNALIQSVPANGAGNFFSTAQDIFRFGEALRNGKLLKPDHPLSQILAQIATRCNATPAQLSLAWLLHRSHVMLPIPGTSKVQHLEENVAAASLQIGPDEWAQLEAASQAA